MLLPLASCFLSLALAPVQGSTAERLPAKPGPFQHPLPLVEIQDLGPYQILGEDGPWLLLMRKESASSGDLNGDGDTLDQVYAVHDMLAGTTTNLGLAYLAFPTLGAGRALIRVRESDQGADLNADGDTLDLVLFAVDLASASARNSGLACSGEGPLIDHWAVFLVPEDAQGQTDLDASGTVSGSVLFAWDLGAATTPVSLQMGVDLLPVRHESFVLAGGAERLYPASDPRSDLNGDGDSLDWVLVVYDLNAPTPVNTGLPFSRVQAVGAHSAMTVSEASQQADLNGDGDTTDTVIFTFDAHTGIMTNLGLASGPASILVHGVEFDAAVLRMNEEALAFPVSEAGQGHTDLNGDGDAIDRVLFVRDYATGATIDLGVSVYEYALGGRLVCMQVSEAGEGVDLDGDGDLLDHVAEVRDLDAGSNWSLGLSCGPSTNATAPPFSIHGTLVSFQSFEGGVHDWNGNGEPFDSVLFLADASAQTITNLGMAVSGQFAFGTDGTLSFSVDEEFQGADLDGDGLQSHVVFHLRSPSGLVVNTHQAGVGFPGIAHRHPFAYAALPGPRALVARTRF